jgi:hypothetical protein
MRKPTLVLITAAALAVPALLAFGVHLAAGTSLTAPPAAVARVSTEPIAAPAVPTDVSGPCDEAEHRNDPRCAPGATTTRVPDDEDRSGSNSGSDDSGKGRNRGRGRSGGDD